MNSTLSSILSKYLSLVVIASSVFVSSAHAQFDSQKMNELLGDQSYYALFGELESLLYTKRDALATNWVMEAALQKMHVPYMYEYAARLFVKRSEVAAPSVEEFSAALTTMIASIVIAKCDVDVCCVLSEETKALAHDTFNNLVYNYKHRLEKLIQQSDEHLLESGAALSYKVIFNNAQELISTKVIPMIENSQLPNSAWAGYTTKARFGGIVSTWIWFCDVEKKLKNICADALNKGDRVKRIRRNSLSITLSILQGLTEWADFFDLKHDNFSELQQSMIMPVMMPSSNHQVVQQPLVLESINTRSEVTSNETLVPVISELQRSLSNLAIEGTNENEAQQQEQQEPQQPQIIVQQEEQPLNTQTSVSSSVELKQDVKMMDVETQEPKEPTAEITHTHDSVQQDDKQ